ncbi:Ubiquitin-conjugating enzyme E2 [Trinorchestia longiramus]|nr:Ubiquitin-conjugating enzyme E2 [Trinorchestia longiramus]
MSLEYEYFYDDEVYRFTRKGQLQLGMVLENAELVSSDEESDVDEEDKVTKGNIRVAWYPNGEEVVISERKVHLADRSLMPGDVVRRLIKGRDTQRGYCRQVRVMARVQLVTGGRHVIPRVDSVDLVPIEEFATDMAISLDSWVGMIHMIRSSLLLSLKDGSSCYMTDLIASELTDVRDSRDKECEFHRYEFYPGQVLVGTTKVFETVLWVHCSDAMKAKLQASEVMKHRTKIRATVQKVEVQALGVRWLCRAYSPDATAEAVPPKYHVSGDALSRVRILNVFEPCTLQLGDRNYYTIREGDVLVSRTQWEVVKTSCSRLNRTVPELLTIPYQDKEGRENSGDLHKNGFTQGINYSRGSWRIAEPPSICGDSSKKHGASDALDSVSGELNSKSSDELAHQCKGNGTEITFTNSSDTCAASRLSAVQNESNEAEQDDLPGNGQKPPLDPAEGKLVTDAAWDEAVGQVLLRDALEKCETNQYSCRAGGENGTSEIDIENGLADASSDLEEEDEEDVTSISSGTSASSVGAVLCVAGAVLCVAGTVLCVAGTVLCVAGTVLCVASNIIRQLLLVVCNIRLNSSVPHFVSDSTVFCLLSHQDGSVEFGIPSSQLYPIHHLDDQEFFPGDFVVKQRPPAAGDTCPAMEEVDPHDYGVVQRVDHGGRTAIVKWFRTYTAGAEPQPVLKGEQEVSVYDLRDHPDFRYRPGSVVIRVANFDNDQTSTTGQVLDNFPTGQVNVWWVDGSSSVCYPQDLYKVGEYDSEEGELWDDGDDEGDSVSDFDEDNKSWKTASDDDDGNEDHGADLSCPSDDFCQGAWVDEGKAMLKTRLVANIEKARIAMSRLEELYTQNPGLQSTQVMKQLLDCYKECRYMDKLMSTRFFHESNFAGLIEKVRERGRISSNQKMLEQVHRLFNAAPRSRTSSGDSSVDPNLPRPSETADAVGAEIRETNNGGELAASSANISSDSAALGLNRSKKDKEADGTEESTESLTKSAPNPSKKERTAESGGETTGFPKVVSTCAISNPSKRSLKDGSCREDCGNLSGRTVNKHNSRSSVTGGALLKRGSDSDLLCHHHCVGDGKLKRPSGSHIKDSKSCSDLKNSSKVSKEGGDVVVIEGIDKDEKSNGEPLSDEASGSSICAVLCSMMKVQLLKTYEEVVSRYGGHFDMSIIQAELKHETVETKTCEIKVLDEIVLTSVATEEPEDATEISVLSSTPPAACSVLPEIMKTPPSSDCGSFDVLESAPDSHKFKLTMLQPNHPAHFYKTVKNEMRLLQSSLPAGIWVRGYQDRMDLYSVMIRGPAKTPYQDGLFFFDFQLSADYPHAPPLCNYVPYCSDRLNPNLYEDGKVCVSLLGTWSGKGTEVWTGKSNLLQVIISIQGLILVSEPYFNEAGYERQKGSQQGHENSRMYNEMVLLKLIQATARMLQHPPTPFKEEIFEHFNENAANFIIRLERWLSMSEGHNAAHPLSPTTPNTYRNIVTDCEEQSVLPEFPLIPASKGFCLTLRSTLPQVRAVFDQALKKGWDTKHTSSFSDWSVSECKVNDDSVASSCDNKTTGAIRKIKLLKDCRSSDAEKSIGSISSSQRGCRIGNNIACVDSVVVSTSNESSSVQVSVITCTSGSPHDAGVSTLISENGSRESSDSGLGGSDNGNIKECEPVSCDGSGTVPLQEKVSESSHVRRLTGAS